VGSRWPSGGCWACCGNRACSTAGSRPEGWGPTASEAEPSALPAAPAHPPCQGPVVRIAHHRNLSAVNGVSDGCTVHHLRRARGQ
jgi:hypothetical protein